MKPFPHLLDEMEAQIRAARARYFWLGVAAGGVYGALFTRWWLS